VSVQCKGGKCSFKIFVNRKGRFELKVLAKDLQSGDTVPVMLENWFLGAGPGKEDRKITSQAVTADDALYQYSRVKSFDREGFYLWQFRLTAPGYIPFEDEIRFKVAKRRILLSSADVPPEIFVLKGNTFRIKAKLEDFEDGESIPVKGTMWYSNEEETRTTAKELQEYQATSSEVEFRRPVIARKGPTRIVLHYLLEAPGFEELEGKVQFSVRYRRIIYKKTEIPSEIMVGKPTVFLIFYELENAEQNETSPVTVRRRYEGTNPVNENASTYNVTGPGKGVRIHFNPVNPGQTTLYYHIEAPGFEPLDGNMTFTIQPPPSAAASTIVGTWSWFNGGLIGLHADSSIWDENLKCQVGSWTCNDRTSRKYTLFWTTDPKYVDTVTLSSDGLSLEGTNQYGTVVTARRVSGP
jgi:hypothetical protein